MVAVRDEIDRLPDLFSNLEGQVDGVVALDDGSTDSSGRFLEEHPMVIAFRSIPPGAQGEIEDARNHATLREMAWGEGADWLLGIDADERVEHGFRERAEAEIDRAEASGHIAIWLPFKELWTRDQFRVDGVWGEKRKATLFKADPTAHFEPRRLHSIWAPWPPPNGEYPISDLRLYHLKMIDPAARQARADLYNRLDPDHTYQAIGYDYLVDDEGIELQSIEPGRGFVP